MSILIDEKTPEVICQGFTGSQGTSTQNRPLHTALKWLVA